MPWSPPSWPTSRIPPWPQLCTGGVPWPGLCSLTILDPLGDVREPVSAQSHRPGQRTSLVHKFMHWASNIYIYLCVCLCVCVCVCVRACAHARARARVHALLCACNISNISEMYDSNDIRKKREELGFFLLLKSIHTHEAVSELGLVVNVYCKT
uniref:Uncharacterized protein n=1 Tax=Pipistrellus kuhlii TaxID=59472 RepID=A0A7J7UTE7_PIPKU|nr:hypothetical protein mPipKuh1_008688 [Pipistrellus kuhlii]